MAPLIQNLILIFSLWGAPVFADQTPLTPQSILKSEMALIEKNWEKTRTHELKKIMDRAVYFDQMVLTELKNENVPTQFFYLAFIKSGFENKLFPKKQNQNGIWLLSEEIAKRYGLKVSADVDERLDPIRSSRAFVRYLKDLHLVFQDWDLVWLGIFMGEKKLLSTLMKSNSRKLHVLFKSPFVPKELESQYVEFLVYQKIYEEKKLKLNKKKWSQLKQVHVQAEGRPLFQVSKELKISYKDILEYNPHLYQQRMPRMEKEYTLWVVK